MKLQVQGDRTLVGEARRLKAERQVALMLSRFGNELDRVVLRLSKGAGTGGRLEKRCEISIELKPKPIRVVHSDPDLSVALERAADKAMRSVARALARDREKQVAHLGGIGP
jgi:putative sigma-54 modulation protein